MTEWNTEQIRNHVERLHGREQLNLLRPSLQSVLDRRTYAKIHFQDFQKLFDEFVQTNLQKTSVLEIALGEEDTGIDYNYFLRKSGAYLIACIQSIHSVPDILAHTLYYSLAINKDEKPLKPKGITIISVMKKLEAISEADSLHGLITDLTENDGFKHLSALSNHSKHRSIVSPILSQDLSGTRPDLYAVEIDTCEYEGKVYPKVIAKDFLKGEYNRFFGLIVATGNELNTLLAAKSP